VRAIWIRRPADHYVIASYRDLDTPATLAMPSCAPRGLAS